MGFAYSQPTGPISMGFATDPSDGTMYTQFSESSDSNLVIGETYTLDRVFLKNYLFSILGNTVESKLYVFFAT